MPCLTGLSFLFKNLFNLQLLFRANKVSSGLVDLYVKSVKESPVEWTKPEKALEASKNVWKKSKLKLVMLSAGAMVEMTCSQQSNKPIWGCFAPSIREIRSTSPLETPEEDNTFVIRTSGAGHADKELLFRVGSSAEKSSWILVLRRICSYQESR